MSHSVEDDSVLGAGNLHKLRALVVHLFAGGAQALAPFGQGDLVVIVRVAAIEKVGDARLHRQQWCSQREQFVSRHVSATGKNNRKRKFETRHTHLPIMWLAVEVAELPDDRIDPFVCLVVVAARLEFTINARHLLHSADEDMIEPFAHTPRKVFEFVLRALLDLLALSVVVDVHVFVLLGASLLQVALDTIASMLEQVAVRLPGGVVVRAHLATIVQILRAFSATIEMTLLFHLVYDHHAHNAYRMQTHFPLPVS